MSNLTSAPRHGGVNRNAVTQSIEHGWLYQVQTTRMITSGLTCPVALWATNRTK